MRAWLLATAALLCFPAWANDLDAGELKLVEEHAVEGIKDLSGLTYCEDQWWAVSDRVDDQLFRLRPSNEAGQPWQAEAESFEAPPAPPSSLPWGLRTRIASLSVLRGGSLDFEGIACDAQGNRYLVSESRVAVLELPVNGQPRWLALPDSLLRQARASGMLLHYNALYEGIAIDPRGNRLWLAAERQRRGLLVLHRDQSLWRCSGGCVLQSEGGLASAPAAQAVSQPLALDYSDLAFHKGHLFTLQRLEHKLCRRSLSTGQAERCWSFAETLLTPERQYPAPYGVAEALWIDDQNAWIGLDNNGMARGDGDKRPQLLRFAAPSGGWNTP